MYHTFREDLKLTEILKCPNPECRFYKKDNDDCLQTGDKAKSTKICCNYIFLLKNGHKYRQSSVKTL